VDQYQQTHADGGAGGVFIRQPEVLRQHEDQYPWFLRKEAGDFDSNLPLKFRGVYGERAL
ncbi:hypothetical protein HQ590_01785, partial [bacterium]|nr:hypothetical protein [bacterium]